MYLVVVSSVWAGDDELNVSACELPDAIVKLTNGYLLARSATTVVSLDSGEPRTLVDAVREVLVRAGVDGECAAALAVELLLSADDSWPGVFRRGCLV